LFLYYFTRTNFFLKVVAILGIAGACRQEELTELKCSNIISTATHLIVYIPETKTNRPRSFALVVLPSSEVKPLEIFQKYVAARPAGFASPRFFYQFHSGKGACQHVGVNTIGKIPSDIAKFLGLEDFEDYTGHSFRRSSASWLADSGADKDTIMRHGGWKSSAVAEGYVETSVESKKRIAGQILGEQNEPLNKVRKITHEANSSMIDITSTSPGVKLENCYSCTINITINQNK
jgi:integrase